MRGITFQAEFIPKILDGSKTVTRRTSGLKGINGFPDAWCEPKHIEGNIWQFESTYDPGFFVTVKCPYGQTGSKLYLRETWASMSKFERTRVGYKADMTSWGICDSFNPDTLETTHDDKVFPSHIPNYNIPKWKPSRFMPEWASRKKMKITVWPERLQDITIEEAKLEGFDFGGWTEDGSWQHAKFNFAEYWGDKYYITNEWAWRIGW